jgi:hypothetical protein
MAANADFSRLSSPVFMACRNSLNGHLAGIRAARKLRAAKTSAAGASSVKHVSRALAKIANAVISSIPHLETRITTFIDQRELRIIRLGIIVLAG